MNPPPDRRLVNLRQFIAKERTWLQEQLHACASGRFTIFSVEGGRKVDTTSEHIAQIKRMIAEHDRILDQDG
jgi:hypothetical protein